MAKQRTGHSTLPLTWAKAPLPGTVFRVALSIARYADPVTRECWPAISRMMLDTDLERRQVTRALGRLREVGALSVVGKTPWGSNIYKLHDEVWAEVLDADAPELGIEIDDESADIDGADGVGANLSSPPSESDGTTTTSTRGEGNTAPPPQGQGRPGASLPLGRGNPGRPQGQDCPPGGGKSVLKPGAMLPPRSIQEVSKRSSHEEGDDAVLRRELTPAGLLALEALARASKNPGGWTTSVRGLAPGGIEEICTWTVLSMALCDMSGNGMEPNVALLRGCIRKTKQHLGHDKLPRQDGDHQGGQLRDIA